MALPPSALEKREKLEQLRALEAGMRIDAEIVETVPLGVDSPRDLERARAILKDFPTVSNKIIAYQGEPGANSHMACADVYPGWETLPCASFEDAFAAISEGRADLGMIPIENSLAGRVADIHHFLAGSGLHIIGEYFLPIHFHLLGVKGAKVEGLRSVYSHIHALGQCRKIIREHSLKPVTPATLPARRARWRNGATRAAPRSRR